MESGGGVHFRLPVCKTTANRRRVDSPDLTVILQRIKQGDQTAAAQLLPLVYEELRRLAAAKMARETPGQTLQPTALVHEAWLRLGGEAQPQWANRAHFFAAAAESMRRILIDQARRKQAARHGGGLVKVPADATGLDIAAPGADNEELLLISEALDALAQHDARKAELVKLKYFAGLTLEEAAAALDIAQRTAKRDWAYARAWLFNEVQRLRA
jgi:RNA polymerase sigma factor (TIGR02999 family)